MKKGSRKDPHARVKRRNREMRKRRENCPSGKLPFADRAAALFFARTERIVFGACKGAYECQSCGQWHLYTRGRK